MRLSDNPQSTNSNILDLPHLLGDRFTENLFERSFYQRDLASVPKILARILAKNLPDAVARPQNAEEVAAIVRYAREHRVVVVPRAAATTVYWNAVPVRGGIVVDLTGLRGLVGIDESKPSVTVLAGTRWAVLEEQLKHKGYSLCSYPTSAPAATVGGWVNMVGYGIGSLQYGGLNQLIQGLKIVLPDGQIVQVRRESQPPLNWFIGTEGTLGIVVEVELSIRKLPEQVESYLIAFPNLNALQKAALILTHNQHRPFYMHISTRDHLRLLVVAGFQVPSVDQPVMGLRYEGTGAELIHTDSLVRDITAKFGGTILGGDHADAEWSERFYSLRLKRAGPTLLGSEFWLPLDRLTDAVANIERLGQQQHIPIATYADVVMPDRASVMAFYPSNESKSLGYIFDLSLTNRLYHLASRHGGSPYGIGFWNMPYLHYSWSKKERTERRRRKSLLDPMNLMNPGKIYSPPIILTPFVFNLGMSMIAFMRRVLRIGAWKHSTAE